MAKMPSDKKYKSPPLRKTYGIATGSYRDIGAKPNKLSSNTSPGSGALQKRNREDTMKNAATASDGQRSAKSGAGLAKGKKLKKRK